MKHCFFFKKTYVTKIHKFQIVKTKNIYTVYEKLTNNWTLWEELENYKNLEIRNLDGLGGLFAFCHEFTFSPHNVLQ